MYQKANGETVWLKAQSRSSYLVFSGRTFSHMDFETLKTRLYENFEAVSGLSGGATVLVRDLDRGGAIIFCLSHCRSCALIAIGAYEAEAFRSRDFGVIENFFEEVRKSLEKVSESMKAQVAINSIRCETSFLEH